MVCSKCAKKLKSTQLATPDVKRRSEMYYGSSSTNTGSNDKTKGKATLGSTGIGKVCSLFHLHSFIRSFVLSSFSVFWVVYLIFCLFYTTYLTISGLVYSITYTIDRWIPHMIITY